MPAPALISSGSSDAPSLARRLIARQRETAGSTTTKAASAALAAEEVYESLSRWIGSDGCHALFVRARALAVTARPALDMLYLRARAKPYVEKTSDAIGEFGDAATADAIESMLVGMIDLLGRLIGVDMATNLIERSLPDPARDVAGPAKRRAKA